MIIKWNKGNNLKKNQKIKKLNIFELILLSILYIIIHFWNI